MSMAEIRLELGQTVATDDSHVTVVVEAAAIAGKRVKLSLVVESQEGRQSLPAELLLVARAGRPA
jgi:hypothetical protein